MDAQRVTDGVDVLHGGLRDHAVIIAALPPGPCR
jgi:hypothetical protein